jgi:hypothetical protein
MRNDAMNKFAFQSGQKPLAGYTLKRGIGHGGFGEVYFAVSDAGKEVALKLIRANLDIELRGIQQCLNLKHPNLVHLYDLRTDEQGNTWLVMEFVAGESLNHILGRHPNGIAPDLACAWFAGLAAAVHCLHDHGIVHRDLKPANIFLEHGHIKVGDYGLCKFIGASQRVGQTESVGTVHYMAPEISTGNYNRQIDIYAAGVILYEMLAGQVPFEGETAGEILMKHLTSPPDLGKVPAPFAPILDKALAKNPALRYQTIAEMGRHVAAQSGQPILQAPAPALAPPPVVLKPAAPEPPTVIVLPPSVPGRCWLDISQGMLLSVLYALLLTLGWGLLFHMTEWQPLMRVFFMSVAASWAVLIPGRLFASSWEERWKKRLIMASLGLVLGVLYLWLQGYSLPWVEDLGNALQAAPRAEEPRRHPFFRALYAANTMPAAASYLGYFGLMFLILKWWKIADPRREQRFHLFPAFAAAFWAYMLFFLLPVGERVETFAILVIASLVPQWASPIVERLPRPGKRLRLNQA